MGHVNETYNFDISAHENLKLNYVTRNALKFKHDHLKKISEVQPPPDTNCKEYGLWMG